MEKTKKTPNKRVSVPVQGSTDRRASEDLAGLWRERGWNTEDFNGIPKCSHIKAMSLSSSPFSNYVDFVKGFVSSQMISKENTPPPWYLSEDGIKPSRDHL